MKTFRSVTALITVLLALPASAHAATARVDGGTVRYTAAADEANALQASYSSALKVVTLVDPAGITPGVGCARQAPTDTTRVQCTVVAPSVAGVTADLGDGNDKASVSDLGADLNGGDGRDTLRGGPGRNTLSGGNGQDKLVGGTDDDRITGGAGTDRISGRGGADVIDARDGLVDVVSCGGGSDRAKLDGFDYLTDLCEKRARSFPPAGTVIDARLKGRSALVDAGCPRDAPPHCEGTVSIRRNGKRLATKRVDVDRATIETVKLRLKRRVVRKIQASDHYFVQVVSRTLDRLGRTRIVSVRFDLAG